MRDSQSDLLKVWVVGDDVVEKLWDFVATNDSTNFFVAAAFAPKAFGSLTERIDYAGYRYVVSGGDYCDSSVPGPHLLRLMKLLDDQSYEYEYQLQGCYEF